MTNKKILTNPTEILKKSINLIDTGQLELASQTLNEALKNFPKEFSFINLLAQISLRNNHLTDGIYLLKKSLEINENQPLALLDLGIALSLNSQLDEAIKFFDKSAELDPTSLTVHIRKAITLKKLNRFNESIDSYQRIIDLSPDYIDAYINKAELLYLTGKLKESLNIYEQILKIDSSNATYYIKYGNLLNRLGRVDEAITAYRKSIEINPDNSVAYKNIGIILKIVRKYDESYFYLKKSIDIDPDFEVYSNLGQLCCQMGNNIEGISYFDKANILDKTKAEAHNLKAYAHIEEGEFDKAILSFDKAIENEISHSIVLGERRYWKNNICDWSNFNNELELINLQIKEKKCVSTPLDLCSFFDDPEIQKLGAKLFVDHRFSVIESLGLFNKYSKNKKIKIGYFSGDFSDHPVGFIIADLFERHDKEKFELFGFSVTKKINSETRNRIKKSFDEFIDVENYSDKDVALLAREKKIDIAIDLGGYTKSSRPGIFAMRAAPIQISYLGYPGTTGTNYIDYIISDKFILPKASQKYYTEKIIYLPKCYQPNEEKLPVSKKIFTRKSQGLPDTGFVFCCFNNSWKITPKIFKLWITLLSNVPESVLWFPGFSDLAINNLRNECKKLGMTPKRLIFSSLEKYREDHYERIKLADIFLDCYPYGGHSTVSDFLRRGVPVVTLKGTSISNSVASSLLFNLSLSELITSNELDYEKLAIKLATNPKYLKEIKFKLISNVNNSTIYNINEYTKNIESGYHQVYDRYHNSFIPAHIEAR